MPALSSSSEASLDPARTQKRSSPSPSALSSKSRGEQSFNQASIILSLDLAEARNPLLSLTGCREKGFNGHRRVERNESLTLQERGFFLYYSYVTSKGHLTLIKCFAITSSLLAGSRVGEA